MKTKMVRAIKNKVMKDLELSMTPLFDMRAWELTHTGGCYGWNLPNFKQGIYELHISGEPPIKVDIFRSSASHGGYEVIEGGKADLIRQI